MRAIVFPHDLEMGGSQLNAIELAAAVRDLGVETTVIGTPGALNRRIDELGLNFVPAPRPRVRPTPSIVRALRRLSSSGEETVLHGWEWPPALECYLAAIGRAEVAAVSTVMSMSVAPFIPKAMPLMVGTEQIAATERASGRASVAVLEPPVDMAHNTPVPAGEVAYFRREHGISADDFTLVCVTRLAHELKAEGILSAMRAMADMPDSWRARLVVVGDGPARKDMEQAAHRANGQAGRQVVTLTGQLLDPRPAYAAADAVLGMGGSALRALAYSKPLVVQGEKGFFSLLEETSTPTFLWQGWYGVGSDRSDGPETFRAVVARLAADPALRGRLGELGHRLVTERFSLTAAARRQLAFYGEALARTPRRGSAVRGAFTALPGWTGHEASRRLRRALGSTATDDFNHKPVAGEDQSGREDRPREPLNQTARP